MSLHVLPALSFSREQGLPAVRACRYLKKAEAALESELQRVKDYLNPSTERKLLEVCELELLAEHEMTLLENEGSGCKVLFRDMKEEDLRRMFLLFKRVPDQADPPQGLQVGACAVGTMRDVLRPRL